MKLFCRKEKEYAVCAECRVHFEPDRSFDNPRFSHLCPTHRKPLEEREARKRVVMAWIEYHWEEYEEIAKKQHADNLNQLAGLQAAALRQQNLGMQGGIAPGSAFYRP